jgi:sugar lactone lactonase YvrE
MNPAVSFLTLLLCSVIYGQSFALATVAGSTRFHEGAAANSVPFRSPQGLVSDPAGGYYFSDSADFRVFRVSATGAVTLVAGTGQSGHSGDGRLAQDATLSNPGSLALDRKGNLYVADSAFIRKIDLTSGTITTFAGNGSLAFSGEGGPALQTGMYPASLALDPAGQNLYLADTSRIRRIDLTTNVITTFAGNGTIALSVDGSQATKSRVLAKGLSFDSHGNLAFVEGQSVKQIKSGIIGTVAGTGVFAFGPDNVNATLSELPLPFATAYDSQDNLYIATGFDVRMVSATTGRVTKLAGSKTLGSADGSGALALFSGLGAIAITPIGDILVTDPFNKVVRRITNVGTGPTVSIVAGTDVRDGGAATSAFLDRPESVAADFSGNFFIADTGDSRIRSVAINGNISTAIGPSNAGNPGAVHSPSGVAVDGQGAIFVADTSNQRILRQRLGAAPDVLAGDNGGGFTGDGGPAASNDAGRTVSGPKRRAAASAARCAATVRSEVTPGTVSSGAAPPKSRVSW